MKFTQLYPSCLQCNSLFRSLSAFDLCKLQCVLASLASIVTNTTKYSHITPVRKTLHWLPIEHCSIFKTALLVYKFLHSGYPKYFYLSLNLDVVFITHVKANLMVCCLRSHTLSLQYISLLSVLASALLMMLQRYAMTFLMIYLQPLLSTHSERITKLISLQKDINPNFSFSQFLSVAFTPAMARVNDYIFFSLWCT